MIMIVFIIGSFACLFVGWFMWMFVNAHLTRVLDQEIILDQSPNAMFRFLFISDVHRRKLTQRWKNKVTKPVDIICIGGDFAERGVSPKTVRWNLQLLHSIAPIVYVWGNNDREIGEEMMRKLLKEVDATILDNEVIPFPNHSDWGIVGVDDPSSHRANALSAAEKAKDYPRILYIAHSPVMLSKMLPIRRPDIAAVGHTHGGQIQLGRWSLHPEGKLVIENNRAVLISNGYGTTFLPLRWKSLPESHIIEVHYQRRSIK